MRYKKTVIYKIVALIASFLMISCSGQNIGIPSLSPDQQKKDQPNKSRPTDALEQFNLASRYDSGDGVPKNIRKACSWYKKSAETGFAPAQAMYGYCLESGRGGTQDDKNAVYWYQQSAPQGNLMAINNLATFYKDGKVVPKDCFQAAKLYRQAAEGGIVVSQKNMGEMYRDGCGVEQNHFIMMEWFKVAALNGELDAPMHLGYHTEKGQGVPRNLEQAYYWSLIAAGRGQKSAQHNAPIYRKSLTPDQISRAEQRTASFKPRTAQQQQPQIEFNEFTIRPERIPAGGNFKLIVRYTVSDPRVPYQRIPVDFRYELSQDGEVLLSSKSKTIQSPNGEPMLATNRSMKATRKTGTYSILVYLKYGDKVGKLGRKDFVIE